MKKISHVTKPHKYVVPSHRSFRRFVSQMFSSLLKRQDDDAQDGFQAMVLEQLQRIADSIELFTREMNQQGKRRK